MTVHHNLPNNELPSAMSDLLSIIENEIPEGRQNLQDSHHNLEKVADYCETNYFQVLFTYQFVSSLTVIDLLIITFISSTT